MAPARGEVEAASRGWPLAQNEAPSTTAATDPASFTEEECDDPREVLAHAEERPALKQLLIPMTCIFQGYGAYVVLQHFLKSKLDANKGDRAATFTAATTFMHWGKLFSRVGHDIVFGCFSTRHRVYVAMVLTLLGVLVPPIFVYAGNSTWLGWAFFHFGLLGVGVGIFESTFLSVISPLGKNTKAWAIMGAPLGLAIVDIVCQILHSKKVANMDPVYFYWYIAIVMPLGMWVFHVHSPREQGQVVQVNILTSLRNGKGWLIFVVPFLVAKIVSSFVMENTPGWYYVFNGSGVPLLSPSATTNLMDPDFYFVVVYIFVLVGDAISRRIVYFFPTDTVLKNVLWLAVAIFCSVAGFLMEIPAIAVLTWFAAFFAFWGNGMCYGVSAKYIDKFVPHEHNRATYSLWCMLGDLGGICGAWAVTWFNSVLCSEHYTYECVLKPH